MMYSTAAFDSTGFLQQTEAQRSTGQEACLEGIKGIDPNQGIGIEQFVHLRVTLQH